MAIKAQSFGPWRSRIAPVLIVVVLATCLVLASDVFVSDDEDTFTVDGIEYMVISENDGTAGITAYVGSRSDLTIPETVEHGGTVYDVVAIGRNAFYFNHDLESLYVPGSVREIYPSAFESCTNLRAVQLSDGLETLGQKAFFGCHSLGSVTLPKSVSTIGFAAFESCSKLKGIFVDELNPHYRSDDRGVLFEKDMDKLIKCPEGIEGAYTVPDGVLALENGSFYRCSGLTLIQLPEGLQSMGVSVFSQCTGLRSMDIPDSVTSIETNAFHGCDSLRLVTFGSGIRTIGASAFYFCEELQTLDLPIGLESIGADAFRFCSGLTEITIPEGVRSIGTNAFFTCYGITRAQLPASVMEIGTNAFKGCTELLRIDVNPGNAYYTNDPSGVLFNKGMTALIKCPEGLSGNYVVPESVRVITSSAFASCLRLTSISLPHTISELESSAFENCSGITSMSIPESAGIIHDRVFNGCTGLRSVSLPDGMRTLPMYTFSHCESLERIDLPSSVETVGDNAFFMCSGLTSISLPEGIIEIRPYAFSGCSGLTSISLPNGISSISSHMLSGCTGLKSMDVPANVRSIDDNAFLECSGLVSFQIPAGTETLGNKVFEGCSRLTEFTVSADNKSFASVDGVLYDRHMTSLIKCPEGRVGHYRIPDGVVTIRDSALSGCARLTSIHIPSSLASFDHVQLSTCSGLISVVVDGDNDTYASLDDVLYSKDMSELLLCPRTRTGTFHVPSDVTHIRDSAFQECAGLTSVVIGTGVEEIGAEAFRGCTGLSSLPLPDSIKSIDAYAFMGCSGLTVFTIPDGVTRIGHSTFKDCVALTSVSIPLSVVRIDNDAFSGCASMTTVTIHENIERIGSSVFTNCTNLVEIRVLDSNTEYSSNDEGVLFNKDMTELIGYPTGRKGPYVIPDTVVHVQYYAFYGCKGLTSITLPAGLTKVGGGLFDACTSLTEILVDEGNPALASYGGALYNKDLTILLRCPEGRTGSLVLPPTVTMLHNLTFANTLLDKIVVTGGDRLAMCDAAFVGCSPETTFVSGRGGYDILVFEGANLYREIPMSKLSEGWIGIIYYQWVEITPSDPTDDDPAHPSTAVVMLQIAAVFAVLGLCAYVTVRRHR